MTFSRSTRRLKLSLTALALVLNAHISSGQDGSDWDAPPDPFVVSAGVTNANGENRVWVSVNAPEHHYLYEKFFAVEATPPAALAPSLIPKPHTKIDPLGEPSSVYEGSLRFEYRIVTHASPLVVSVSYMGCSEELCHMPQTRTFSLQTTALAAVPTAKPQVPQPTAQPDLAGWQTQAKGLRLVATRAGFVGTEEFLAFLNEAGEANPGESDPSGTVTPFDAADDSYIQRAFNSGGLVLALIACILLGITLNLTPCVLPMIPVNIAIIGAGSAAGSRGRGMLLGAVYGLGITLAYGGIGLAIVLTAEPLGAIINASAWFNAAIAVLFLVLSLAMFGVFNIDFTSFTPATDASKRGRLLPAFSMGAISALLAGACVAPVLISMTALTSALYNRGITSALLLPFALGLGMALPWPFAGAGMSFLPKPGRWMERVKIVFGVIILVAAIFYGQTAYRLATTEPPTNDLEGAMKRAIAENKPLVIDFWATWCKNCKVMDNTTFADPTVKAALDRTIFFKYQAENPTDPETRKVLKHFRSIGLPTYVLLVPEKAEEKDKGPRP